MSVTAITAVTAHTQNSSRQQDSLGRHLMNLQEALSTGNLATAQRAARSAQQDLHIVRPQQNGIRVASDVNPESTMRADLQALQSALDAGDLALAEEALIRIQQDSGPRIVSPAALAPQPGASELPQAPQAESAPDSSARSSEAQSQKTKGSRIDVNA